MSEAQTQLPSGYDTFEAAERQLEKIPSVQESDSEDELQPPTQSAVFGDLEKQRSGMSPIDRIESPNHEGFAGQNGTTDSRGSGSLSAQGALSKNSDPTSNEENEDSQQRLQFSRSLQQCDEHRPLVKSRSSTQGEQESESEFGCGNHDDSTQGKEDKVDQPMQ